MEIDKIIELEKKYAELGKEIAKLKEKPRIKEGTKVYMWEERERPENPYMGYYKNIHIQEDGVVKHRIKNRPIENGFLWLHCEPIESEIELSQPKLGITLWIARDKNTILECYNMKPHLDRQGGFWWVDGGDKNQVAILDPALYPTLEWYDEPIELQL